jgi:hypothetical protein
MLLNKNTLAIGIIFLFILSAVTPIVFGYNVKTLNEKNKDDKKWTAAEIISTESTNNSRLVCLDIDQSENIHAVWLDWSNYSGSNGECNIYYKMKTPSGGWTTTEIVSTENTKASRSPALAVEPDGTVHVVLRWFR